MSRQSFIVMVRAKASGHLVGAWLRAGVFVLWSIGVQAASSIQPMQPVRVVLLTGFDPMQPSVLALSNELRSRLETSLAQSVEVEVDAIDGSRSPDNLMPDLLALMKKKYASEHVDLVVGLGSLAAKFTSAYHAQIWPATPVLLSVVPDEWLARHALPADFAHVPYQVESAKTLDIAEALQPDARQLVVVSGTTDADNAQADRIMTTAAARRSRWPRVEAWHGLPLQELQAKLATLDLHTAVIYAGEHRDRDGRRYVPYRLVAPMVAASRAPVYGLFSIDIRQGAVAGAAYDFDENGRLTADAALAILRDGGQANGRQFPALPARCTANVAQIERHGLAVAALPADCLLLNLPRSLFREYRVAMLVMLLVLIAQGATILALLAQRRTRRRAQAEAVARRSELARAARFATVGELSASIAHEVGQPLGAILSNADAAELLVKASRVDHAELEEILADVKRDALRANEVVQRLRALLQKQGVTFCVLPLDETLRCALTLVEPEARRRNIMVDTRLAADHVEVLGDRVQLQQVVLNLAINAMDAMHDTEPGRRLLTLESVLLEHGVEFSVTDRGAGVDAALAQRLFEPFYTTKEHGMGLGLSIVRSIVEAHRGRVSVASRDGGATSFVVWLPRATR
ncbi:ATP-binding protein [Paraburkholderia bannensis]|uniref:ATP-binding protein n=1 Tax=Paraburkholderia bannensis TaxID=765414 RepID=UPI002AB6910C|nr:ATP-binding protein [Paraburkholderia bannensis]